MVANRTIRAVCLLGILVLALLRVADLSADPPLNLTTSGVLYTDEGQYGRNAVHWATTGQWYTPGDYNPAIIYPVATALQMVAFKLLGLSLASARVVTVLFAWLTLFLVYRLCRYYVEPVPALVGVLLLAASYRFFSFSRLALLDIPMISFALLSLTLGVWGARRRSLAGVALSALAFVCCWLTKLGIYFPPVVLYGIYRETREKRHAPAVIAAWIGICVALLAAYTALLALPYGADYRYLMQDVLVRLRPGVLAVMRNTAAAAYHAFQADPLLAIAVAGGGVLLLFTNPSFRASPLLAIALLWALCRIVSLGGTPYQPPRYLLPIHVSLAMGAACIIQHLRWPLDGWTGRPLFVLLILLSLALNVYAIASHMGNLQFTFTHMCADIEQRTAPQSGQSGPVLMGNVADSISLETGVPAVNDRLGSADLPTRVRLYEPTHYVSIGPVESGVGRALEQLGDLALIRQYDVLENYYTGEPVYLYSLERKR